MFTLVSVLGTLGSNGFLDTLVHFLKYILY